jgi:hypothetical protein
VFVDVDFTTRFYFLFAVVIFPCIEFSFFRLSPSFFLFLRRGSRKIERFSSCIIVRPARAFNTHTHTHFNTLTRTETLKVRFKRHALGGGEYCLTSNFTAVFVIFVHVVRKRERITSIRLVTSGSHPSLSRIPLRFEARAISTTRRDDADDETNLFYFFLNRVVLKAKRSYNNNNKAKEKKKKFVDSRRRSFRERKKKKK